jgi:hypothetical protein
MDVERVEAVQRRDGFCLADGVDEIEVALGFDCVVSRATSQVASVRE